MPIKPTVSFLRKNYKLVSVGILLLCGIMVYANTFSSSFHLDDEGSIVKNLSIKNITDLKAIWDFWPTRFVTYFSLAINYHFHKLQVFGYHFFNLAVHLLCALSLWQLILLTFSTPTLKDKKSAQYVHLLALFTALIFVAHPVQTQGVTYIIQRAVSLTTLFYLVTLCMYVWARLLRERGDRRWLFFYSCSLLAAVFAMFTKEISITLPMIVLLYEFYFLKTKKKIAWKLLIPFFISLFIIPLTMVLTASVDIAQMRRQSEFGPLISQGHYFLTQPRVLVTYLRLAFFPVGQNLDYDYPVIKALWAWPFWASLLFLSFFIFVARRIFSKEKIALFGIFWFFITLLPESSVIPIRDLIFEHRLYLPMAGFSLFLVSGLFYLLRRKRQELTVVLLSVLVFVFAVAAYQRNNAWKDDFTLWSDVISKSPHKARPLFGRGFAYLEKGELDKAIADFNQALEFEPAYLDVYNSRGNIWYKKGDLTKAIADFSRAIEINPRYAPSYYCRANTYQSQGNLDKAIADYDKAIILQGGLAECYINRGNAYQAKGDFASALIDYNKALGLTPDDPDIYNNRGNLYQRQGLLAEAIGDFTQAIKIDPGYVNAYSLRGSVYQAQGNLDQAIADFNAALILDPRRADVYNNRSVAYFFKRQYDRSWDDLRKAQALGFKVHPGFLEALKKYSNQVRKLSF